MVEACPIPTPAERAYGAVLNDIETALMRKIHDALDDASQDARTRIDAAGLGMEAPVHEYFVALVHQQLFCLLCGADPKTFAGGRAGTATSLIRNAQNIARHYWGADLEPKQTM